MGIHGVSGLGVCLALAFATAGCELPVEADDSAGTTGDTGAVDAQVEDEAEDEPAGWRFGSHPCFGYRTDTLWVDDPDHLWIGCGTTTSGYGLFRSSDGGRTWDSPPTDPPHYFDGMRVNSVSRSADGALYVAGLHGAEQVLAVDTSVEPMAISEVFTSTGVVWDTWQVGSFRRASSGLAVAESLNGYGLAYRHADDVPFEDGDGAAGSHQILELVEHADQFYGVGSTISEPPFVFLPPRDGHGRNGFSLEPIQMVDGLGAFAGELWGIDVDDGGIVAVGVNQDRDVGYVFVSGADPYDVATWRSLDVSTLVGDEPTWMRGACRSGDRVVALGEYSRESDGLILLSEDGGVSFRDVTPTDEAYVPAVHRCSALDDGTILVVGAEGFVAVYEP